MNDFYHFVESDSVEKITLRHNQLGLGKKRSTFSFFNISINFKKDSENTISDNTLSDRGSRIEYKSTEREELRGVKMRLQFMEAENKRLKQLNELLLNLLNNGQKTTRTDDKKESNT